MGGGGEKKVVGMTDKEREGLGKTVGGTEDEVRLGGMDDVRSGNKTEVVPSGTKKEVVSSTIKLVLSRISKELVGVSTMD